MRSLPSINDQCIGMVLYSLRGMSSDCSEVREIVEAFAPHLRNYESELTRQCVANMLYGCQRLTSDWEEVRGLCAVMADKINAFKRGLDAQSTSNGLFGLQGLNSAWPEVRQLLAALAPQIRTCSEEFLAQHVGNSLYGCQGMNSDDQEVCDVLAALAPQIRGCSHVVTAQQVGNAMLGLQGMGSDKAEVRAVVAALVPKIADCREPLKAQEVGSVLYALQGMTHDCAEVRDLLAVLQPKVLAAEGLNCLAIGNALYGLLGVLWAEEFFTAVTAFLYQRLTEILYYPDGSSRLADIDCEDVVRLRMGLGLVLPEAKAALSFPGAPYEQWDSVNTLLTEELAFRRAGSDPFFMRQELRSVHEAKVHDAVLAVFRAADEELLARLGVGAVAGAAVDGAEGARVVVVEADTHLFDFVECDVLIRLPLASASASASESESGSGEWLLVNIEVDGIHHRNGKRSRFCHLRDKYLAARGVVVERVMTSALWDMGAPDTEAWVLKVVEAAAGRRATADAGAGAGASEASGDPPADKSED